MIPFFGVIPGQGEEGYVPIRINFPVAGHNGLDDFVDLKVIGLMDVCQNLA